MGIDEVGRGSLAGPVVASAVILTKPIIGLNDSKKITRKKRSELAAEIKESAIFGTGWVWPDFIDQNGLTAAIAQAMRIALSQISVKYKEVIIDGNYNFLPELKISRTLIKADQLVPEVSAASIIAKVERDNYMITQAKQFPNYNFDRHMGYGTRSHLSALGNFGPCEIHRKIYKPIRVLMP